MNRIRRLVGACALIVAFAAGPARAADVADPVVVTPSFRALATELLTFTGADSMSSAMARLTSTQIVEQMRRNMPGFTDSTAAIVKEEMLRVFDENRPKLTSMVVEIYARHFSESELRDMLAFYHTPAGGKMIQEMPGIMQETVLTGQVWGQHLAPVLIERIQKRLSPPAASRKS